MTQTPRVIRMTPDGPDGLRPMELDADDFQSPLPQQNLHVYFSDPDRGLTVGIWDTTTMQEEFGPYPSDEFILVLKGEFAMLDGDNNGIPAKAGQLVAFRNGAPVSWKQDGYLKKFFMTLKDPTAKQPELASAEGGIVVMDPNHVLTDADILPTEDGDPVEREVEFFTNDDETMTVGLWDSQATIGEMEPFPAHEIVFMIDGGVTIHEPDGVSQTFVAGDAFFIPKGTMCRWEIPTYIRKYFAAVDHED